MNRPTYPMLVGAFLAPILAGAACAQTPVEANEPAYDVALAEMGATTFTRRCGSCHGDDARGNGPAARVLRVPPADLTRIAARREGEFPDAEIARFIDGRFDLPAHGSREMPIWGARLGDTIPESDLSESVTRGKIATLIEYLKSVQRAGD